MAYISCCSFSRTTNKFKNNQGGEKERMIKKIACLACWPPFPGRFNFKTISQKNSFDSPLPRFFYGESPRGISCSSTTTTSILWENEPRATSVEPQFSLAQKCLQRISYFFRRRETQAVYCGYMKHWGTYTGMEPKGREPTNHLFVGSCQFQATVFETRLKFDKYLWLYHSERGAWSFHKTNFLYHLSEKLRVQTGFAVKILYVLELSENKFWFFTHLFVCTIIGAIIGLYFMRHVRAH